MVLNELLAGAWFYNFGKLADLERFNSPGAGSH
jgi:hypothetical protein